RLAELHGVWQVGVSGVVGAALFAPVAMGLDAAFGPFGLEMEDEGPLVMQLVDEFAALAPPVAILWLLINAPRLIMIEVAGAAEDEAPAPPPPADEDAAAFWERMPRRVGREVVAMTAELHYLRVFTTKGEALILFPISRAEAALGPAGMRVHRSHWAAFAHAAGVEMAGARAFCVVDAGGGRTLRLPVSRPNRAPLRSALKNAARAA
ncbi:MAG: LytTR family DNA-binding domain-containing protein, partial [Pseudomonadota bacterium]